MRYKPKGTAALHVALGGLPDNMRPLPDTAILHRSMWTKSLTRESRFDSRLQIRGGSLEPRRSDRGRVAYFAGVVAGGTQAWKARPRAPACGQSQHHQRHLMAASHRCTVARCAGKVWEMELSLSPLSALARLRCV